MKLKLISCLGFILTTLILTSCSNQPVKEGPRRLALLIANNEYQQTSFDKLNNPINDAKAIAKVLQKTGFISFIYRDIPDKTKMEGALNYFLDQIQ